MSRSGYFESDDGEVWGWIMWSGAVKRAIEGKRGQALLTALLYALDAMPEKKLIAGRFVQTDGQVCALGALAIARKDTADFAAIELQLEDGEYEKLADHFDIAESLAREIMFQNDDDFGARWNKETPEARWVRVRKWVAEQVGVALTNDAGEGA